jgi:glycosyltransferase involved in cell wall biosynthesis
MFNARHFLPQVLTPLLALRDAGQILEVIVVDDRSTDQSADLAAEMGAEVVAAPVNAGPGAARNIGAARASGDILWFVDADVVVQGDGPKYIHAVFEDPLVVAVFGSYDDRPPAQNFASQYKNLIHHYYHQKGRRQASTFWAGCGAVRKQAFLDVGGFDAERYTRPSIEDIELGYRLRAAGQGIVLEPDLRARHLKVWTVKDVIIVDMFRRALPWSRLMVRQAGLIDDLNVGRPERFRAAIACAFWLAVVTAVIGGLSWWVAAALLVMVLVINKDLLVFFQTRRSASFALAGIMFHQVYYLYSSAVYAWCWIENRISPQPSR